MKKVLLIIIFVFFLMLVRVPTSVCNAASEDNLETQLKNETTTQLDMLDLSELDELISNDYLEEQGIKEYIEKIINGENVFSIENVFNLIKSSIKENLSSRLTSLLIIVIIALLSVFISSLQLNNKTSVKNIVFYTFYISIISIVVTIITKELLSTINILNSIQKQVEVVCPILLSLMAAIGATSSVAIYQPAVLIFGSTILKLLTYIITPIFLLGFVCVIISNLSGTDSLSKFQSFFMSLFKTLITVVFTVFIAFLSIQGITASSIDGVSIKTAKFAIRSYVPILGGYLSEGFEVFRAGSVLIKNSVGVIALILLFLSVFSEIISIVLLSLGLKLVAALTEPICDKRISSFLSSISKCLSYLIVILLAASVMYFIILFLMISSANVL